MKVSKGFAPVFIFIGCLLMSLGKFEVNLISGVGLVLVVFAVVKLTDVGA